MYILESKHISWIFSCVVPSTQYQWTIALANIQFESIQAHRITQSISVITGICDVCVVQCTIETQQLVSLLLREIMTTKFIITVEMCVCVCIFLKLVRDKVMEQWLPKMFVHWFDSCSNGIDPSFGKYRPCTHCIALFKFEVKSRHSHVDFFVVVFFKNACLTMPSYVCALLFSNVKEYKNVKINVFFSIHTDVDDWTHRLQHFRKHILRSPKEATLMQSPPTHRRQQKQQQQKQSSQPPSQRHRTLAVKRNK